VSMLPHSHVPAEAFSAATQSVNDDIPRNYNRRKYAKPEARNNTATQTQLSIRYQKKRLTVDFYPSTAVQSNCSR